MLVLDNKSFNMAYVFLMISIMSFIMPCILEKKIRAGGYKIAFVTLTGLYFLVQLCICVFIYFKNGCNPAMAGALSVGSIMLYVVGMAVLWEIAIAQGRKEAGNRSDMFAINELVMKIENCRKATENEELKSILQQAEEDIRYSNLKSSEHVKEMEQMIIASVEQIEKFIKNNRMAEAKKECSHLQNLLHERNQKCLIKN